MREIHISLRGRGGERKKRGRVAKRGVPPSRAWPRASPSCSTSFAARTPSGGPLGGAPLDARGARSGLLAAWWQMPRRGARSRGGTTCRCAAVRRAGVGMRGQGLRAEKVHAVSEKPVHVVGHSIAAPRRAGVGVRVEEVGPGVQDLGPRFSGCRVNKGRWGWQGAGCGVYSAGVVEVGSGSSSGFGWVWGVRRARAWSSASGAARRHRTHHPPPRPIRRPCPRRSSTAASPSGACGGLSKVFVCPSEACLSGGGRSGGGSCGEGVGGRGGWRGGGGRSRGGGMGGHVLEASVA